MFSTCVTLVTGSRNLFCAVVLQEPDVFGVRWEAANGKPGYADLCIRLMDAAYSIVPGALLFVEGTGQSGLAYNWGKLHVNVMHLWQDLLHTLPACMYQGS